MFVRRGAGSATVRVRALVLRMRNVSGIARPLPLWAGGQGDPRVDEGSCVNYKFYRACPDPRSGEWSHILRSADGAAGAGSPTTSRGPGTGANGGEMHPSRAAHRAGAHLADGKDGQPLLFPLQYAALP